MVIATRLLGYKDKKSDTLGGYFFVTETYLCIFYACFRIE